MGHKDHGHDHDHHGHDHDHHGHGHHDHDKDPEEQAALARDLAGELTELFEQFVRGEIDFAEVSFATYDVLQDLHVVATGAYELVEADEDDEEDDEESATEEQEDLSGEPAR